MFYRGAGQRIFAAALGPDAIDKVVAGKSVTTRHRPEGTESSLIAWIANSDLTPDLAKLWDYGGEMYNASCALCHTLPPTGNYLANQWTGNLNR